jgi:hypothetical protein
VLKSKIAIFNLILNIVVVDINVFSTLIVAFACCKLDRGLVVTVELNRAYVVTLVVNLFKQARKLGSFFCSVGKANVLSFSS